MEQRLVFFVLEAMPYRPFVLARWHLECNSASAVVRASYWKHCVVIVVTQIGSSLLPGRSRCSPCTNAGGSAYSGPLTAPCWLLSYARENCSADVRTFRSPAEEESNDLDGISHIFAGKPFVVFCWVLAVALGNIRRGCVGVHFYYVWRIESTLKS